METDAGAAGGAAARAPRAVWSLRGHGGEVLCLAGSGSAAESPNLLLSGSDDATARVWDVRTCRAARMLAGAGGPVAAVSFVPGAPHSVLVGAGTSLLWYDLRKEAVVLRAPRHSLRGLAGDEVSHIAVNAAGTHAAVADDAGGSHVVALADRSVGARLLGRHEGPCTWSAFRATRPWEVLTGGTDQRVVLWNFSRGAALAEAAAPAAAGPMVNPPMVYSLAVHPNDGAAAAALGSGHVALYDLHERRWAAVLAGHHAAAASVLFPSFSPRRHMVSAANDRTLVLWDLSRHAGAAKATRPRGKRKKKGAGGAAGDPEDVAFFRASRGGVRFPPEDVETLETGAMADRVRLRLKPNWVATAGDPSLLRVFVAGVGSSAVTGVEL